ncbi:MAG: hypothetical protein AVDCRST_MAG18-4887, partial [uncultured Thermomicrobiales bacterium]
AADAGWHGACVYVQNGRSPPRRRGGGGGRGATGGERARGV